MALLGVIGIATYAVCLVINFFA